MSHILIVDDDIDISNILAISLEGEGYEVTAINHSIEAKNAISKHSYDLIILDIMMPIMDGYDLCKHARYFTECPIIFITCLGDEESLISALTLGGDDYIKKPFNLSEVLMRVRVHLRRMEKNKKLSKKVVYETEKFSFYPSKNIVVTDHENIHLSPLESDLLKYFLDHKGQILSYKNIYEAIWNEPYINDKSTVMVRVSNLRNKLSNIQIETNRGQGYRLVE